MLFFFGGACSLETEPLATIAGNFYKIPTVSHFGNQHHFYIVVAIKLHVCDP